MAEVIFEAERKYTELLIGCGHDRRKLLTVDKRDHWENLITLDINERVNPDVVHDLNVLPYPFLNEEFDEVHAYEVLEHCGTQGNWEFFFAQFTEFWRILKPGGLLYGTCPSWSSVHAWGDPGHTRIINEGTITFLRQDAYGQENLPTTDYRGVWQHDFEVLISMHQKEHYVFCLRKR